MSIFPFRARSSSPAHLERSELPLFPLRATLFPDGVLSLKVFEQRYCALVKRCLKEASGFGIVTLTQGSEVGRNQRFAAVGTYAQIESFDTTGPDLFVLSVRGVQRFALESHETDALGLHTARIRWIPNEPDAPVGRVHVPLAELLRHLVEQWGEPHFAPPYRFESASWVSGRLAEVMQMPPSIKQAMLEINDPTLRLQTLAALLERAPRV
ncbi:MAG: LON peptidase substrate-binding domain-containing protein [Casimicrobiaceae bacterium]|nr:LON peptidase substrate-binding domain-containing protein [Casimicrobiaceae bacterium]